MKLAILACSVMSAFSGLSAQTPTWQPAPGHAQIPLWPGTPPNTRSVGAESVQVVTKLVGGKPWSAVYNVSRPTMTVYSPAGTNAGVGAAVVVFPGGGYNILAIDLEGTEVCDWLTAKGITCVLLKYRVPESGPHWDNKCQCHAYPKFPTALQDAQRALSLVRFHAAEWHLDPHKIGVLGFSAGGHLVAATSTHLNRRAYSAVDAADKESFRPDFAVALYPGHLWITPGRFELNPEIRPTKDTPPTFIVQAENDDVDYINNSLVYYVALQRASVSVELHLFAEGGHAFGLRPTKFPITQWPRLVETWLATIGMVPQ